MNIEALKSKALAATPGEWNLRDRGVICGGPEIDYFRGKGQQQIVMCCGGEHIGYDQKEANERYIVAAQPRVVLELIDRIEQAEAENARLRDELAERSWRVIGPNFENLPSLGQKVMIYTDGKVIDAPAKAGLLNPNIMIWERYVGIVELCTPMKPGDAWIPWPEYNP